MCYFEGHITTPFFHPVGKALDGCPFEDVSVSGYSARARQLAAMNVAIAAYETEFVEITEAEMAEQHRVDRANAIVVRRGRILDER